MKTVKLRLAYTESHATKYRLHLIVTRVNLFKTVQR
jgi:hypothetical protein